MLFPSVSKEMTRALRVRLKKKKIKKDGFNKSIVSKRSSVGGGGEYLSKTRKRDLRTFG